MVHFAAILSVAIASITLSLLLVSYVTMDNNILIASSDEGGDGGGGEGGDSGGDGGSGEGGGEEQNGDGEDGQEEGSSEQPADDVQGLDGTDRQPAPQDQLQQPLEGEQGEEIEEFVLCEDTEVFIPETGGCQVEIPQAQGGSKEICDNSKDDDLDGNIDESNCVPPGGPQQAGIASPIPPTFTPNLLAGQIGGWGLPQGITQGLDQGQGQEGGSDGSGSSGTNIPPVPSFSPSSSQGSTGTPATLQGSGSGPTQGATDGGTTRIPSFAPSSSTGGGNQGGSPGTNTNTPSTGSDNQEDSGSTGSGGAAGQQGSAGGGGSSSSSIAGTSAGSGGSTSTGMYTDPQGRFSIGYPPNAKVTPAAEGSPGDKVVTFTAPPPTEFTSIGVEVTDTGEPVDLESHVNSYLVALETALPDYTLVESPDCVRYALGGQKACAYIYTVGEQSATTDGISPPAGQSSSQGSAKAIMELFSVVGNSLYKVSYSTLPAEFNGQLPVAEGMIRSLVLLNGNVS